MQLLLKTQSYVYYSQSHLCNSKNWGFSTSKPASRFLPPSLSLGSSGKTSYPLLCPSSLTWAAIYPNCMGKCLSFLPVLSWSITGLVLLCLSQKAIFQWQKEEEQDRDGLSQDGTHRDYCCCYGRCWGEDGEGTAPAAWDNEIHLISCKLHHIS